MSVDFVHLRVHSEYSIEDGMILPQQLPEHAAKRGMPAVALTDINNCFALLKFYQCARECGVKPILGCELRMQLEPPFSDEEYAELVLLVGNEQGYRNLCTLVSDMWRESRERNGPPVMQRSTLSRENTEGLIALSGAQGGEIGVALGHTREEAARCLEYWMNIFDGRFYLEVQRIGRLGEAEYLRAAHELAMSSGCPLVATNNVCFVEESEYEAHEARVCISEKRLLGDESSRRHSRAQYLRSAADMCDLFADLPEALKNSVEIAKRCNVSIDLEAYHLPRYQSATEGEDEKELLKKEARSGLRERLQEDTSTSGPDPAKYEERMERELAVIEESGFAGYFLVVMDFVRWALREGIPVGPGRGSGAGSLVAWALRITDVDPLRYGLLFERFLNAERIGLPDFDIDFCQERRDRVMEYVRAHYGESRVAGIVTFNRMAGRAVVRHVARVQGKAYAVGDRIARAMSDTPGMTMQNMLGEEQKDGALGELTRLLADDAEAREVWDMARTLEGLVHNVGRHAGGVVIAPDQLLRYSPLCYPADADFAVTHYDKDDIERVGLVKFDFLGLRTLTVIDKAERAINRAYPDKEPLRVAQQELGDPEVYKLLCNADTVALFQLESEGMRELMLRYQPSEFEDLVVLISLYRPGPLEMGMHTDYVERRNRSKTIDYYGVPALKQVLADTYGVFLYQEQVMESARVLANFSLGEADILRRAMGKKKREEMAQQREKFVAGAVANNLSGDVADRVFDVMEKFSGYGFNKSHAVAYALIAYRTAWLKTHYAPWFMAAEMSTIMTDTDALEKLMRECKRMGIDLIAPDINRSDCEFEVDESGAVVYALGAIKGIGRGAAETICSERAERGNYVNMLDFCLRLHGKLTYNQAMLEILVCAGCFDDFAPERSQLMAQAERVLDVVKGKERMDASGGADMFGATEDDGTTLDYVLGATGADTWTPIDKLNRERSVLGLYLSGHPLDFYRSLLVRRDCIPIKKLRDSTSDAGVQIAGSVDAVKKVRRNTMAVLNLNDGSGMVEVRLNPTHYARYRDLVAENKLLIVRAQIHRNEYSTADYGLSATPLAIEEIAEAPEYPGRDGKVQRTATGNGHERIVLAIDGELDDLEHCILSLKELLNAAPPGDTVLRIRYRHPVADVCYEWHRGVARCDDLLMRLRELCGKSAVWVESA